MIEMRRLESLASKVVNEPWGCGDSYLSTNYESWAPYYRWLHAVVQEYHPKAVLECGVYLGVGTAHMAIANRHTKVIGIDIDFHPSIDQIMYRYPNVSLIHGDTRMIHTRQRVGEYIQPGELGLLFLDSEHDGITPSQEFENFKDLFADECIVVCDDIIGPPERQMRMKIFWDWLPGEKKEFNFLHPAQYQNMPTPGFGVSIVRKYA